MLSNPEARSATTLRTRLMLRPSKRLWKRWLFSSMLCNTLMRIYNPPSPMMMELCLCVNSSWRRCITTFLNM